MNDFYLIFFEAPPRIDAKNEINLPFSFVISDDDDDTPGTLAFF